MTLLKKLLLFGGVPAAGASAAAAAVPFVLKQQKNEEAGELKEDSEEFDENEEIGTIDLASIEDKNDIEIKKQKALLWAAGLKCKKSLREGSSCIPIENKGLRLKVGNNVEESLKFSSSSKGKLVLRKNKNTYSYGLRLSVEGEDITLEKADKSTLKLERFESYGLEAQGQGAEKKLHLIRKQTHQEGVMRALGIPTNCQLPLDRTTKECSLSSEEIKSVHFDGKKEGGATIADSTKTISLKISKSVDTSLFKEGYRFAFSSSGAEITINNGNVIKTNASTEFTVKEWKDENMVLVRAGSGEKEGEFFGKVGLKCTGDAGNETCTIEDGKLNVIKANSSNNDNKLTEGKKTETGKGIIKLHRDQANYVNGLKFSIEKEDITISGNPTDSPINRLSLFDGYEIAETGGKFYLKRKEEGLAEIVKRLGLLVNPSGSVENPTKPVFNTSVASSDIQKMKFYEENKEVSPVGTAAIDVNGYRSTDTTNYKYGYRFTLKPNGDVTIGNTKLKENVTYDFKIREESGNLYLERTIDPTKIKELLGLSCNADAGGSTESCTFQAGKANVRHWGDKKNIKNATVESQAETVKLKLTKDQPGFTDGFMFTVEGGDITFSEGTKGGEEDIRMAEFEKYEIQLKDGVWYLYQKKNFMQVKYEDLGINEKCNNEFYSYCELGGTSEAEKLKFKVKKDKTTKVQFSNNAKVLIKLKKDPKITTGIKVGMIVGGDAEDRNISVVCDSDNSKTLLKLTKDETIFKIEKIDNKFYLAKEKGEESNETCNSA